MEGHNSDGLRLLLHVNALRNIFESTHCITADLLTRVSTFHADGISGLPPPAGRSTFFWKDVPKMALCSYETEHHGWAGEKWWTELMESLAKTAPIISLPRILVTVSSGKPHKDMQTSLPVIGSKSSIRASRTTESGIECLGSIGQSEKFKKGGAATSRTQRKRSSGS